MVCALSAYLGIHDLNKLKFYIFPQNFKALATYSLIYIFVLNFLISAVVSLIVVLKNNSRFFNVF